MSPFSRKPLLVLLMLLAFANQAVATMLTSCTEHAGSQQQQMLTEDDSESVMNMMDYNDSHCDSHKSLAKNGSSENTATQAHNDQCNCPMDCSVSALMALQNRPFTPDDLLPDLNSSDIQSPLAAHQHNTLRPPISC